MRDTFQVGDVHYNDDAWGQNQTDYIKINIRRDRRSILYTAVEAGFLEWMVAVGGITSSLMSSLGITASVLSRYIFISEILKKLYMVKYTTNPPDIKRSHTLKVGMASLAEENDLHCISHKEEGDYT